MTPTAAARRSPMVLGVLSLAAVALCLRLGFWQLDRAAYKQQLHQQMEQRMRGPALELLPGFQYHDALRFRAAVVRGHFIAGAEVLLDNRVHAGQAGAAVYAPFVMSGEPRRLLVERGWVPWSKDHAQLPEVELPTGELELRGYLDQAPLRNAYMGEAPAEAMQGRVWPYLDWARLAAKAGPMMDEVVLREDAPASGALLRIRPSLQEKRGMHIGYAVQWFAFAAIVALVAGRLLWNSHRPRVNAKVVNP